MSVAQAKRRALGFITAQTNTALGPEWSAVMREANDALLHLAYNIGRSSGFDHEQAVDRCAALALQQCAIHLADDIADGECDYVASAERTGTTLLYCLQHAFGLYLAELKLPSAHCADIHRSLLAVGQAQHIELNTIHWQLASSKAAAEGLNGTQFRALFGLLVPPSQQAHWQSLGFAFGVCTHLANDIKSRDPRFEDLTAVEQKELKAWGRDHLAQLAKEPLPSLQSQCALFMRYLG